MTDSIYSAKVLLFNKPLKTALLPYIEKGILKSQKLRLSFGTHPDDMQEPAFYLRDNYDAAYNRIFPKDIRDVLPCILQILPRITNISREDFHSLRTDLYARNKEIEHGYDTVRWESSFQAVGGDYDPSSGLLSAKDLFLYNRFEDISHIYHESSKDGFLDEDYYKIRPANSTDDFDWEAFEDMAFRT